MNIHPIVVHFPVALLTLWSVIEIIRPSRWLPRVSWPSVSAVLLLVGFVSAFAALLTGDIASEGVRSGVVETHEHFAQFTVLVYGLFVIDFVLPLVLRMLMRALPSGLYDIVMRIARVYERLFQARSLRALLAIVALGSLTITGILGGVMVYGPTTDSLAPIVMSLLGLSL